jgi:hypothetical protein
MSISNNFNKCRRIDKADIKIPLVTVRPDEYVNANICKKVKVPSTFIIDTHNLPILHTGEELYILIYIGLEVSLYFQNYVNRYYYHEDKTAWMLNDT